MEMPSDRERREEEERKARIDEANRQNEIERLERARKEREGEVHFRVRVSVERVNVFPPKSSGRSDVADPKPIRKVTEIEAISLHDTDLDSVINRVTARLGLVHDDGVIDPLIRPVLTRRSAPIGEDFDV